ncbi:MAG TPA: hypothetical protein VGR95_04660 [Thermoanaerobaculia bacterium]|jgi:hypothetical protein|nr:hypothetical protein [Thermoanaerobaculia bacterium]
MSSRRAAFIVMTILLLVFAYDASAQLTVTLGADNSTIYYSVSSVTPPDTSYCVTAIVIDGVRAGATGNAPPCAMTPAISGFLTCHTLGPHTISAEAYNPSLQYFQIGQPQTVVVSAVPSFCNNLLGGHLNFDINDNVPASDREVLLSNTHVGPDGIPDTPYPHYQAFLAKDKQIPVDLRIIYNGAQTSGITVTMSVIDPPDPAPYVAGGSGTSLPPACLSLSHSNDNIGPLAKLTGADVTDNANGTYTVTSGANGAIETVLQLDNAAVAGDNYRVTATATFPDGSVVTANSGVITAWKRVFLEKRAMFRRGVTLASDAPIGVTHITIPNAPISSRAGTKREYFANGNYVMLLHAPGFGTTKTPGSFYSNIYQVAAKPHAFTVKAPWPTPATGTVQISGTTVVGTGTHFNSQVNVDDVIDVPNTVGGTDSRVVVSIADNTHLTVNFPFTFSASNLSFFVGDPKLIVGNAYFRLTLDRKLTEAYVCEPLAPDTSGDITLNDGVARVGSNIMPVSAADYFDVTDTSALTGGAEAQWTNPFPASFTEYVILPAAGLPLPHEILTNVIATQRFIDKWFTFPVAIQSGLDPMRIGSYKYPSPPNQQALLVADCDEQDVSNSGADGFLSDQIPSERASILDRATVEHDVSVSGNPLSGANVDTVLRRTTVHELTHQWWPNGMLFGANAFDHCHEVAYDSQAPYPPSGTPPPGLRFCLMSNPDGGPMMPDPSNPSLFDINMVEYYYRYAYTSYHAIEIGPATAPTCHSEYLAIRQKADPWTP